MGMELWQLATRYASQAIYGVIILFIGLGLGLLVRKLVQHLLHKMDLNKVLAKVNIQGDVEKGIGVILSVVIYLLTIVAFLYQLGIQSIVLYLLVGAVLMLLVLTILVGLKDVIPNCIGWLVMQKKGQLKEGKIIEIREINGMVERVGYLETEIRTERGDILYVPNSLFLKSKYCLKK